MRALCQRDIQQEMMLKPFLYISDISANESSLYFDASCNKCKTCHCDSTSSRSTVLKCLLTACISHDSLACTCRSRSISYKLLCHLLPVISIQIRLGVEYSQSRVAYLLPYMPWGQPRPAQLLCTVSTSSTASMRSIICSFWSYAFSSHCNT